MGILKTFKGWLVVGLAAWLLAACGGGGGDTPAETQEQCESRCVAQSCAGASGNGRLLCGISCARACTP